MPKWRAALASVFAAVVGVALFLRHGGSRNDSRRRMRHARAH
jgi:hypothetical protein